MKEFMDGARLSSRESFKMVLEFLDLHYEVYLKLLLQIKLSGNHFYHYHVANSLQFQQHRFIQTKDIKINSFNPEKVMPFFPSKKTLSKLTLQ